MGGKGANRKRVKGDIFGARVIFAEAVNENNEVAAHTIAPRVVSSILHTPRVDLDHRSKTKIARAQGDFAAERQRIAALMQRIKSLEADAILSNQKIADVEDLLHISRELNYRRLRKAKRKAMLAKTSAAKKATQVAKRIREKVATSLQIARNKHRAYVHRRQREHEEACQRNGLEESQRLDSLIATREATINNKLHSDVDYVRKQRDAEIAILKKQHEA